MNKNLKRIIAIALAIGTLSAVGPISKINLLTTKAYASSDDNDDKFDSLKLETSGGDKINLYTSDDYDSDDKVSSDDVDSGDEYYAKTSVNKVKIDTSGVNSKYVRVFYDDDDEDIKDSAKGKKLSSDINLESGHNTIVVRIYSEEPDSNVRYDDEDNQLYDYTIHVKCTGSDSDSSDDSNDSDSYDDIYLDKLSIDGESISLSDSKTTYDYNVASNVDAVSIKAVPPDEDDDTYTVTIDGTDVDSNDKFKHTVDLNQGKNEIKIELKDDDDNKRVYTLNINRGGSSSNNESSTAATTTATSTPDTATSVSNTAATVKIGWVLVNGGWQYYDSTGTPLKNQWFFDRNYGKWYYLGADGVMAHDTYVGQYRVGTDGAWIA